MAKVQAAELISLCFAARTQAHILHLTTRSYAQHTALGCFYDEIVGLADAFAETYIGEYGLIDRYPGKSLDAANGEALMDAFISWVTANRQRVCDSAVCQALIDDILTLAYSTRYKLKVLK